MQVMDHTATDDEPVSYEEVLYEGVVLPSTHPQHLAMTGRLFGMNPARATHCRVLELGCGTGGNIVPMAYELPGSQFTGIDLSPAEIGVAQGFADALGVQNLTLRTLDIRDLDESFGEFDYIIAYGVYSWVPPDVQKAVLRVCKEHLAPQGIAVVSYNVFPGWHMRMGARQMMLYHSLRFPQKDRTQEALNVLGFVQKSVRLMADRMPSIGPYGALLDQEAARLEGKPHSYLAHEHLSRANDPLYLYQFVERAEQAGLRYLADSDFGSSIMGSVPEEVSAPIEALSPDSVTEEQYSDFVTNRMFRESLLCHAEVARTAEVTGASLGSLNLSSQATFVEEGMEGYDPAIPRIRNVAGSVVSLKTPETAAAVRRLISLWPEGETFDELLANIGGELGASFDDAGAARLASALLTLLRVRMVEFRSEAPMCVGAERAGERPIASEVARLRAPRERTVVNARHQAVDLEPAWKVVLPAMDGTRTRSELAAVMALALEPGNGGEAPRSDAELLAGLDEVLERLGLMSLLKG